MSTHPEEDPYTHWDLADRLRKSLRVAGMEVQEMAEYLEVTRGTVGNWINGRNKPSNQTLRLWSMRTGAQLEWLKTGTKKPASPDRGDGQPELPVGIEPTTFSLQGELGTVLPFLNRSGLTEKSVVGGLEAQIYQFRVPA